MARMRYLIRLTACALLAFLLLPGAAGAQTQPAQEDAKLSQAQLEQLVAPIALYPDPLLSQVMMASTYPLEVVEAARWSKANPGVSGQAFQDAMQKQSWDPSVKGLTAAPQTLEMMSDKLGWTKQLGDAVLAQQEDVLAAVQTLRVRADNAGNLKTTALQRVTKRSPPAGSSTSGGVQQVIVIEPTSPDQIYVPIYDPGVVYGAWPWAGYEPFYWYPSGWAGSGVVSFAAGIAVGAAIWGGVDWWRRHVNVNVNRFNQFNRTQITNNRWTHNAAHRGNVPYRNAAVARRFQQGNRDAQRQNLQTNLATKGAAAKTSGQGKGQAGKNTANAKRTGEGKNIAQGNNAGQGKHQGQAARDRAGNKQANRTNANRQNHANRTQANRNHADRATRPQHAARQPSINRQAVQRHGGAHAQARGAGAGHRAAGGRGGHGGRR